MIGLHLSVALRAEVCEKHYISVCVEGNAHKMAIPYCVLDVSLRAGWLPVSVSADCVLCDGSSEESSVTVAAGRRGRQARGRDSTTPGSADDC